MTFADRETFVPSVMQGLKSLIQELSGLPRPQPAHQSVLAASALAEFGAFETALDGNPEVAARLIQIASELDDIADKVDH